MLTPSQYIVCFGHDFTLLDTRRQILEQVSYTCIATADLSTVEEWMLSGKVGIIVLCHTLTTQDVESIFRSHHAMQSSASILRLRKACWNFTIGDFGLVSEAQATPTAFTLGGEGTQQQITFCCLNPPADRAIN